MNLKFHQWILVLFLGCFAISLARAQDQSGFISLNCGANTSYTERATGINYEPDTKYIDTGVIGTIKPEFQARFQAHIWDLRSFPEGIRNCYHFNLTKGDKYLIRADFVYGNYDDLNTPPTFDVHIGSNIWKTITFPDASTTGYSMEAIYELRSRHLDFCLVKKDSSVPFISTLELRPLSRNAYNSTGSLEFFNRLDIGSKSSKPFRFNNDVYDRFWLPFNDNAWIQLNTTFNITTNDQYRAPWLAMMSASFPRNISAPMNITLLPPYRNAEFYVYMYFAELQELRVDETREFSIIYNGKTWFGPFSPNYLATTSVYSVTSLTPSTDGRYEFLLQKTDSSTHPPLLNAMEIYLLRRLSYMEADESDVTTIRSIKLVYKINNINWQGDPCGPPDYMWDGLNCSSEINSPPRITSLNLSSNQLEGVITPHIFDINQLTVLDLSNNNLSGPIPEFLSEMPSLKVINLSGNKLNGSVPPGLLEKSNKGLMRLSYEGNRDLCVVGSCSNDSKKKRSLLVPVAAAVASAAVVIAALVTVVICLMRRNHKAKASIQEKTRSNLPYESALAKNRQFTYAQIEQMTNNFERVLGRGGFGVVYHGVLNNNQVAVKMLDRASIHGYKQFTAEVEILLRVHHKTLVNLVGYCDEGDYLGLIYEFMANGDLKDHLSGKASGNVLSWKSRLKIATEAAQGLEYMHHGCRPPIIHRDVKTTNILLDENFEAKLADFGLSRSFPTGGETHVSTVVAGTPGYLDPEYYRTNWLTDKSDVYSFGIVLLEMITNQPVIDKKRERHLITEWVGSIIATGDIKSIVDPKLNNDFDINSVWKAVELALSCANLTAKNRPNMNHIVMELNECLALEMTRTRDKTETDYSEDSMDMSMNYSYTGVR